LKVKVDLVRARLGAPFVSASGELHERELVVLRLEDADGYAGSGEAAPLGLDDEVGGEEVVAALEGCRRTLMRSGRLDRAEILADCSSLGLLPSAAAAIDLALWDLAARRAGQPLWRLLGATDAEPVTVNYTIAAPDRAGASAEALQAARSGFSCVKVKVGIGDDGGRLAAVRATAGPEVLVRLDANGAWSVAEAEAALDALAPIGIELCEEPVHGLEETAALAAITNVPLAIDESAATPGALDRRVCGSVCLKVTRSGGITGLLEAARRAGETGYDVYLASMLDGPLGIAAALHAAAVLRPRRACGLATLPLFADRPDPLPAQRGRIAVPSGLGLGDGLMEWYGLNR
jgi:L-alanine-DL-glutamate epimerase-like enolase superfamily enzyme